LRARARFNRWDEEWVIVKNEMIWTKLWFEKQRRDWIERGERSQEEGKAGHVSYAKKQVALWEQFEKRAEEAFRGFI